MSREVLEDKLGRPEIYSILDMAREQRRWPLSLDRPTGCDKTLQRCIEPCLVGPVATVKILPRTFSPSSQTKVRRTRATPAPAHRVAA